MDIQKILQLADAGENLADEIDKDDLSKIGNDAVQAYDVDLDSRREWDEMNHEWMKLALQIKENKTYPWKDAANIKYPLLTTAALQFSARAYPSLVPSFDIVKAKPLGKTPQSVNPESAPQMASPQQPGMGMAEQPPALAAPPQMGLPSAPPTQGGDLQDMSDKISTHMSYQLLCEMDDWEEEMDKLCLVLPIIGCAFKKTYYSKLKEKNCSELVLPKDLVVNYWTKTLESAPRKTHRLWFTPNEFQERQRIGFWKEYDDEFTGGTQIPDDQFKKEQISKQTVPAEDDDQPRQVLEQHTYLDLDEDGYKEPYVITVDYETHKVLRIAPRFQAKDVMFHPRNPSKVAKIHPREFFTKFSFIPNPDGSFYDLGFGLLLGSLNQAANTILNQLTDAGTLSNLQSGFLAKGLRLGKAGDYKFQPGEWKPVNNTFDDLKKGIYPLPVREPSNVLFQLLGMLVQSGKEMASIAEIFTGKMPGQNTPASTTMATIEQGLKVFTSIYKRIYRSLGKEFKKLFDLNAMYLSGPQDYAYERDGVMIDETIDSELYKAAKVKIVPAADPNMVTETQKLIQLQSMIEMAQFGAINPQEMTRRGLEIHGIPGIAKLMEMPPPGKSEKVQLLEMELADREKDRQLDAMKIQSENQKRQSEIMLNMAKAKQLGDEEGAAMLEMQLKREEKMMDMQLKYMEHQMDMQFKQEDHALDREVKVTEAQMNLSATEQTHRQNVSHNAEKNRKQLEMMDEKEKRKNAGTDKGRLGPVAK